ncbi:uncharacterized protein V6R79_008554 [Siganus canaliculatus]
MAPWVQRRAARFWSFCLDEAVNIIQQEALLIFYRDSCSRSIPAGNQCPVFKEDDKLEKLLHVTSPRVWTLPRPAKTCQDLPRPAKRFHRCRVKSWSLNRVQSGTGP